MKKLNLAVIGQGRSGKQIHGVFYRKEENEYFNVAYVVDEDEFRREKALKDYPGCEVLSDYRQLFDKKDIDLVVNATYSDFHYPITLDLLEHGFNVLVEKPFARSRYECDTMLKTAKEKGVLLAVFQQTFLAPFYEDVAKIMTDGRIGEILQVSIRYNGFARRWDWQTFQKRCAGGLYNTGPHPVGIALGLLGFDENARVAFSRLGRGLTAGDADDYAKVVITAPNKPVVDVEVSSLDAYSDYNVKIQGTRGTFKCTPGKYKITYVVDGENPERKPEYYFISDENGEPVYCRENLVKHVEEGEYNGNAFDIGTREMYKDIYYAITENKPMRITAEMAAKVISVIEQVHAENPLDVKF